MTANLAEKKQPMTKRTNWVKGDKEPDEIKNLINENRQNDRGNKRKQIFVLEKIW